MKEISITDLQYNFAEKINKEWALVTAGTAERFNTMTVSWGGIGFLWGKYVAFIFIRPERYTAEFVNKEDHFTLSFLSDGHRDILNLCGTKSGRDLDKVKASGLKPQLTPSGHITFEQAQYTLECKKLYVDAFRSENFVDKESRSRWYNDKPGGSLHKMYIVEIEHVWTDIAD